MQHLPSPSTRRSRSARLGTAALAATAAIGLIVGAAPAANAAATTVDIDLVTVNDFHGRIEQSAPSGGIAALATAVQGVRAANPNTVFAAAGDMIGASTFTSFIAQDLPTIQTLNAAGLDVSSVGNHEFDKGWADLRDRVVPAASWDYLGANVFLKNGQRALPAYSTQTFDGVTIGFIGAVTNELPSLVSPAGIADLDVRDVTASVNQVADELTDGNAANGEADVLVLLVHEGAATTALSSATDPATSFGKIVNGVTSKVDAIVSGHTHLAYNHVINGRPVISSGQYGEKFSVMDIQVDATTKQVVSMNNQTFNLMTGTTSNYAQDAGIAATVATAKREADTLGLVNVGDTAAAFNRGLQPGTPNPVENRGGESTLGNFVADVQLWAANQDGAADIAFMNPGGLRTNLAAGAITYQAAAAVQPFANTLVTTTLTGAQVKQVLEEQWQPGMARPFLKLGVSKDLTYTYDPTAATGSHVTRILFRGEPVEAGDSFRVVVNSFLASGGDNFATLGRGANPTDTGKIDLQAMVDWFDANGTATPDLAQRAVGVKVSAPDANGYDAGDAISVTLSSLDFSTAAETRAGTVSASINGAVIGSSAVNSALTVANDEIGTAVVEGIIPAGASGYSLITVTVPATGTTATVPIVVNGGPVVAKPVSTAAVGGTVTISGSGATPGAQIVLELHSTPVVLGTAIAASDGTFTVSGVIPAGTPAGAHSLVVLADGTVISTTSIQVAAAATTAIATTGAEVDGMLALTALLLLAGMALVLRRRVVLR
ncbi:MAG: bifunctional UDP-sugar hydrolase/5'-nucleotidase [Leifsonia sp.]